MSDTNKSQAQILQDQPLTIREHLDPDKHWIGETLAPPTQTEIAATVGNVASPGDSPFVARADHTHKVGAGVVTGTEIANNSITSAKIVDGTIVAGDIANATITGAKIATNTITADKIATNAVTNAEIANDTILATNIAAGAVGSSEIAAGSIGADELMDTIAGGVIFLDDPFAGNVGVRVVYDGRLGTCTDLVGSATFQVRRITTAAMAAGQDFQSFIRGTAPIGSINIVTATTISYVTSSDEDKKHDIVEVDDELAEWVARIVQPYMFRWNEEPDKVVIGYVAQRIVAVWPEAMDIGLVVKSEELGWGIDPGKMVCVLHAAWQSSARKLYRLTERVERLENGHN